MDFGRYRWIEHDQFIIQELTKLLRPGTFAEYFQRDIGSALHFRLLEASYEDPESDSLSREFPVEYLFVSISNGWLLDPEWMATMDGEYFDEQGQPIPSDVKTELCGFEMLVCYGLWMMRTERNCKGGLAETGTNEQGWTREEVLKHEADILLRSYQALHFAGRVLAGNGPTQDEMERHRKLIAKEALILQSAKGGKARAEKLKPLAEFAQRLARERVPESGTWTSRARAVKNILADVQDKAPSLIGRRLSEDQAKTTIDGYLSQMPDSDTLFRRK